MRSKQGRDAEPRSVIGWDGIRFTVPGDWNLTGVSGDKAHGYLKVDSPGTAFLQVKWTDPGRAAPRTPVQMLEQIVRRKFRREATAVGPPDLRGMLDAFLKDTEKRSRKIGASFSCKVKPQTEESDGERIALHFSWTGSGQGQGKVWHCRICSRTVIAQVVGQGKDPVANLAARIFGEFRDHGDDGWNTWGAFDMIAAAPSDYVLMAHKFLSGYLRLELTASGKGKIVLERWGLAHLARRKFSLRDWLGQTVGADRYAAVFEEVTLNEHVGVRGAGRVRSPLGVLQAVRDALPSLRPAVEYEACAWECDETNKLYAVQTWQPKASATIMGDLVTRCECH